MAKKKTAKKKPAAKNKAAVKKLGSPDLDPGQAQLEGFEEDRIPDLEAVLSTISKNETRIAALQSQNKELEGEAGELLHANSLTSYGGSGYVAELVVGEERVVIKKAKKKPKAKAKDVPAA